MVEYEPARTNPTRLQQAVQSVGYDLLLADENEQQETLEQLQAKKYKNLKQRTTWAIILSIPVVIIGMFMMNIPYANEIMWLFSTPVVLWLGRDFFINAWKQAKHRQANMDTLVALSTGIAYVFSLFNMFFPQFWEARGLEAHVYFEAAAVIIAFILLGRLLEERAKGNTSSAIKKLMGLQPKEVLVVQENGSTQVTAIEAVQRGDIIVVKPGEQIAVDGVVLSGTSYVDESMLSGEPIPVQKSAGETVYSGTINQKGGFQFRATKVGKETMLAHIIRMVQDAQGSKAPVQKLVDKIAGIFVPIVIGIAVLTFILWVILGGDHGVVHGLMAAVTVLVIACPCALGLATPTAIMVGVGKGAENGILIKDAESLELAKNVNALILDKTGTITEGHPVVTQLHAIDGDTSELLALAAGLERYSEHPLARAILERAESDGVTDRQVSGFETLNGKGVRGELDGSLLRLGNRRWLESVGVEVSDLDQAAQAIADDVGTPLFLARDNQPLGVIGVADAIKKDSEAAIRRLHEAGIRVMMVTGDVRATADAIAQRAGIDEVRAEVLPEDKAAIVEEMRRKGYTVAMVGDGINDAPALAAADVGFAIGTGTDVAIESAAITLMRGSLHGVADAIEISKATVRNIRQNLFGAFIYNILGIPIAAGVLYPAWGILMSPILAGAAMSLSSVTVVTNANRLRLFRPRRHAVAQEGNQ